MVMNHGENTIRNCSSLQRPQEKQTATRFIPSIIFRNIQGFEGTALVNTEQYEAYRRSPPIPLCHSCRLVSPPNWVLLQN